MPCEFGQTNASVAGCTLLCFYHSIKISETRVEGLCTTHFSHRITAFMTCRDKILSEDYLDLITDYELMRQILEMSGVDACYQELDAGYGLSYVKKDEVAPLSIGYYGYSSIPKLYGLMRSERQIFDPSCLAAMGNIRVQEPPLALQGSGVIIGFIDTGIRYQENVFRREDGSTRIVSIWDQTIQTGSRRKDFSMERSISARILTERWPRRRRCPLCRRRTRTVTAPALLPRRRAASWIRGLPFGELRREPTLRWSN